MLYKEIAMQTECTEQTNYVRGILFDIIERNANLDKIAKDIIITHKTSEDYTQKVILGKLINIARQGIPHTQLVAVSYKIAKILK